MNQLISKLVNIDSKKVSAVLNLLSDGATIPFIARYRKEATGSLDELAIEKIDNEYKRLKELEKRKSSILDRLKELSVTNSDLLDKISNCFDPKELEDLY
ncbi:MAG: Tex-like N-terminal domain-containing protein, partial [Bacteroidia bacterium]